MNRQSRSENLRKIGQKQGISNPMKNFAMLSVQLLIYYMWFMCLKFLYTPYI